MGSTSATLHTNVVAGASRRNASAALEALLAMPAERVGVLQAAARAAAARVFYRGEARREESDAVDVMLDAIEARLAPGRERWYSE